MTYLKQRKREKMSHPSKKQSGGYDSFLLLLMLLLLVQLRDNNMVWFLTTLDSYFTILVEVFTNHILAERTYFTNHREWIEHKIMVLKPANKYIIIWQCQNFNILIDDLQQHPFLCRAKFCKNHFLRTRK